MSTHGFNFFANYLVLIGNVGKRYPLPFLKNASVFKYFISNISHVKFTHLLIHSGKKSDMVLANSNLQKP